MFNGARSIVVVRVGLSPNCSVFQLDHGIAAKAAERTIDAAQHRLPKFEE